MPNRILKESICTSDNINALSPFHETVFYRLIVNCDDYGRMDARPKILSSKLFPLKDVKPSQIEDALRALISSDLVVLYEANGKPYLQMKTWDLHQRIRAKKSKYPPPDSNVLTNDSNMLTNDSTCCQMTADDNICVRNPIQSNTNPNPNPNTNTLKRERFDKFWEEYPLKYAKAKALAAFNKIDPDDQLLETMLEAVRKQKETDQWKKDGGQFIPYPATWLNQHRWEDEIRTGETSFKVVHAAQYEQRQYTEEQLDELSDGDREILKRLEEAGGCA